MSGMSARVEQGSVAFVTGASQGLGEAIGIRLARDGWHVVLTARRKEKLDRVVSRITEDGGSAEAAVLDVSRPDQITEVINEVGPGTGALTVWSTMLGDFPGAASSIQALRNSGGI